MISLTKYHIILVFIFRKKENICIHLKKVGVVRDIQSRSRLKIEITISTVTNKVVKKRKSQATDLE